MTLETLKITGKKSKPKSPEGSEYNREPTLKFQLGLFFNVRSHFQNSTETSERTQQSYGAPGGGARYTWSGVHRLSGNLRAAAHHLRAPLNRNDVLHVLLIERHFLHNTTYKLTFNWHSVLCGRVTADLIFLNRNSLLTYEASSSWLLFSKKNIQFLLLHSVSTSLQKGEGVKE